MAADPEWKTTFLASLELDPNVSTAAKDAGISRQYAYLIRESDTVFAKAWDDAKEQSTDGLETVARKRAVDGSDVLLIFLLKSNRSEIYGDKSKIDLKSQNETSVTLQGDQSLNAIAKRDPNVRAQIRKLDEAIAESQANVASGLPHQRAEGEVDTPSAPEAPEREA